MYFLHNKGVKPLVLGLILASLAGCDGDDSTTANDAMSASDGTVSAEGTNAEDAVDSEETVPAEPEATGDADAESADGDTVVENEEPQATGDDDTTQIQEEETETATSEAVESSAWQFGFMGEYMDSFMGQHSLTDESWTQAYEGSDPSVFHFRDYDAETKVLIAENDANNGFAAGAWSRFELHINSEGLWYCQSVYDAETREAAEMAERASTEDVATAGCGESSPWSLLTTSTSFQFVGDYDDNFMGRHSITANTWTQSYDGSDPSLFVLTNWDESAGRFIAYNADSNGFGGGLWSAFYFAEDAAGTLFYCQAVYDGETAQDAMSADAPSADDPSTDGCGTSPWTALTIDPETDDVDATAEDGTTDPS